MATFLDTYYFFQVDITLVKYMNVSMYVLSTFNVQLSTGHIFRSLEVFLICCMLAWKIYKLRKTQTRKTPNTTTFHAVN